MACVIRVPEWPLGLPGHDRLRGLREPATWRTWPRWPPALAGRQGWERGRVRPTQSLPMRQRAAARDAPSPSRGARQPAPRWEPPRLRRTARAPPSPPPLSPPPLGSSQAEPLRSRSSLKKQENFRSCEMQADAFAGYSVFLSEGKLKYNLLLFVVTW